MSGLDLARPPKRWIEPASEQAMAKRNAKAGRARPCGCGHEWGAHRFAEPHPCLVAGCECEAFKDADASPESRGSM